LNLGQDGYPVVDKEFSCRGRGTAPSNGLPPGIAVSRERVWSR
jgi:hypothetical protein